MKSYYLFCLLLLAGALPSWAQSGIAWQRAYGTAARDERGGIAVAVPGPVGGFLIAGQQLVLSSAARSQVFLVRTNGQGDTLWTRRFVPPLSLQPNPTGLAIDPQGNVLLTVSSYSYYNNPAFSHFIKFNPTCDTVRWQNLYQPTLAVGASGSSGLAYPCVAPDGNYIFLRIDASGSNQTFGSQTNLIKVSAATGAQLWSFDFTQYSLAQGFGNRVTVSAPAPCPGGLMLFVNLSNFTTMVDADDYLFIDYAGNVVSAKRRLNATYTSDSNPVFQTLRDGNVLVARRQKLYKISTAAGTAGDTLWYTAAPMARPFRQWDARDMVEDAAGNILLVGDSFLAPPSQPASSRQIHLVRFTARGAVDKDTVLLRNGDTYARSALLASNGRDLVFSGYATSGPIGGEDLLLARYTGFRPLATVPGAAAGAVPRLGLWPNPAGGGAAVRADLPDRRGGLLRVFDALGRCVGQQSVGAGAATAAVPVAGLPPGVYVLRYTPAGGGPPSTARLLRE